MKEKIIIGLAVVILVILISANTKSIASTLMTIDSDDMLLTDDQNVTKPYTAEQLNAWVRSAIAQQETIHSQEAASSEKLQSADEATIEIVRIQQVFDNDVLTNTYNQASSL